MKHRRITDRFMKWVLTTAGLASVAALLGIFGMLLINGAEAFRNIGFCEFFFSADWNPSAYGKPSYGILSMVVSTFLVTIGAMAIAIPVGIGTAAYLSEVAPKKVRNVLKPAIELLAGVPSVAIGFIGIVVVAPILARTFGLSNGLNAVNGSILLAVMALPTIVTVAEDAIRAVPNQFKEASYALGADRWTTLVKVTVPAAFSGIIAAIILGIGRAIGETMTVLMATGNAIGMPHSYFDSVRTMTATIAIELGEVPFDTTHYYALFAVGAVLFFISLLANVLAEKIAVRFRYKI